MTPVARGYFRSLSDLINRMFFDLAEAIRPRLKRWVEEGELNQDALTTDAAEDELDTIINGLVIKYTRPGAVNTYEQEAREVGIETSVLNRVQVENQLEVLGINIFRETPQLTKLLRRFTARNTRLITSIPTETFSNVAKVVESGIANGLRHEEIARQIFAVTTPEGATSSELQKSKNRAALIARDQTLTMSAELNKARQRSNGIERFIWRTVGDNRVRDLHEPREGREFSWATGAGGADPFPGSGVNCRCSAEPVL